MTASCVTVFGGTGFLGRRVVARLLSDGHLVRIAARHPDRASPPAGTEDRLERVRADVRDLDSVRAAAEGADAVVNAVALYVEKGAATFQAIHVDGAQRVAEAARSCGAGRLIHVSGIGSDPAAASPYVRCRGEGEAVVRATFAFTTVFRPSVMIGPDDAFLNALVGLVRRAPVVPLFGDGSTRLQPVAADDVAAAAAGLVALPPPERGETYHLGGPQVWTYREVVELVMRRMHRRRLLVPVPFAVWSGLAAGSGLLPSPPLTEGQVALMRRDNVAAPDVPGLAQLGVVPTPLERVLDALLEA